MAYETYRRGRASRGGKPMVSILRTGLLGVNRPCFEAFFKGKKHVILLYDKKTNTIGIKPVGKQTPESYPLRVQGEGKTVQISAMGFLKYFAIPHDVTRSYEARWNEQEGLVEIALN